LAEKRPLLLSEPDAELWLSAARWVAFDEGCSARAGKKERASALERVHQNATLEIQAARAVRPRAWCRCRAFGRRDRALLHALEAEVLRESILSKGSAPTAAARPRFGRSDARWGFSARTRLRPFHAGRDPGPGGRDPRHGTDEQEVETLAGVDRERFQLYYNFPPYSVGEIRPLRGPGRREIGHGNLARRALAPVLPTLDAFPYTIKVESEITESNAVPPWPASAVVACR